MPLDSHPVLCHLRNLGFRGYSDTVKYERKYEFTSFIFKKEGITPKIYIKAEVATDLPLFKGCAHSPNGGNLSTKLGKINQR